MKKISQEMFMYSTGIVLSLLVLLICGAVFGATHYNNVFFLLFNMSMVGSIVVFSMGIVVELKDKL